MRRPLTNAPPSRVEWPLESELRGHRPSETIAYLADCAAFEDAQQDRRRSLPPGSVPAEAAEPRRVARLRGLLGRAQ